MSAAPAADPMSQPAAPGVEVEDLVKDYGAQRALDGVSVAAADGRFLVLLGPSGSGKTTLLRCLAGIEPVTAGEIRLAGERIAGARLHVPPNRRDLAMVFQDYALWPHMTARQNVAYALRRRRLGRADAAQRSLAMLDRVGLGHLAERYPSELSGGEQQRVALARALVATPRVLLFDEPLSNLDADLREHLRLEIATLAREHGPTVVYITHDQAEAFALADQIAVLRAGRLEQHAAPEAIYQRPATAFVARFTGLAGELDGVTSGALQRTSGTRVHVTTPHGTVVARSTTGPLPAAHPVRVLVRPAAGTLRDPASEHAALRGRVHDVAFRGRGYEHAVELTGGVLL
ncbi:MAG: ABC transporter ATP-binding protein [Candidatus Dormiibacterota bacterium]